MVVYVEALNVVFPLLNARDLVSCMLVCKQWRDIAANDYFWKALCAKQCPSISKRSTSFPISYHRLFHMLSKCHRCQNSLSPRLNGLSFDDFEFYIYVWAEKQVIFSEIIPCSVLRDVPKKHSLDVHERLMWRRAGKFTKMIRVEPKFSINQPKSHDVSVSVLVGRRDTNNMACLVKKTGLWPSNVSKDPAYASEYIQFIPYGDRFNSSIHPLVTLLSMVNLDVFAIELDFYLFYYYGEVQKGEDKDKDEYDDEDDNDDEEEDEDVDVNFEGGFRWILEDSDSDEVEVEVEVEDKDKDKDKDKDEVEDEDADADAGVNFEEEFLRLVDVLDWF